MMMKNSILALALASILCVSCYPTRIVTVSPDHAGYHYSTTVTVPRTHTMTTTTQVYASGYDICLHLDLQAVAAAFAQSSSIREFESLLNNSSYIISNLDLNRDGYVDYLRVVETIDRSAHLFVIQAVLGRNIFQDVATIVVENPSIFNCYVEIIGDPFIYGPKYIVKPVYLTRPNIFGHLCRRDYVAWVSPWHWDYYPSYYKRPAPIYLNHYQAYVNTYMHNHHYCHEVTYPSAYHYVRYEEVCRPIHRNDYAVANPNHSFTVRNANTPVVNSAGVRVENATRQANARDIRAAHDASTVTSVSSTSRSATRSASSTSSSSSATRNASTTSSASSSASRTASTTSSASSSTAGSASRSSSTGSTSGSTSTSSRASSTTSSTSGSSASRASSTSQGSQTTVKSRVTSSGSSDTSIRTVSSSGSESTVRRGSSSSSSSSSSGATRSSSSSSSSSSGATRSSSSSSSTTSGATRSSNSSSSTTSGATRSSSSTGGSTRR